MATVNAAQLPGAISTKQAAAYFALHELRESEKQMLNSFDNPGRYVTSCVRDARGVYSSIETFACQWLTGKDKEFRTWVGKWESALSADDCKLWKLMRVQRNEQEHGPGLDLLGVEIPLINDPSISVTNSIALFGFKDECTEGPSKGGVRFAAYPNRHASEVCADYLTLTDRFQTDFRHDYAALL